MGWAKNHSKARKKCSFSLSKSQKDTPLPQELLHLRLIIDPSTPSSPLQSPCPAAWDGLAPCSQQVAAPQALCWGFQSWHQPALSMDSNHASGFSQCHSIPAGICPSGNSIPSLPIPSRSVTNSGAEQSTIHPGKPLHQLQHPLGLSAGTPQRH